MCLVRVPGELVEKLSELFCGKNKFKDSKTFVLFHYYTFIFIAIVSFLTTIQEFFGDPIYCNVNRVSISMITFFLKSLGLLMQVGIGLKGL